MEKSESVINKCSAQDVFFEPPNNRKNLSYILEKILKNTGKRIHL